MILVVLFLGFDKMGGGHLDQLADVLVDEINKFASRQKQSSKLSLIYVFGFEAKHTQTMIKALDKVIPQKLIESTV